MKTLRGRPLQIALGLSELPMEKVLAYRRLFARDGFSVPPLAVDALKSHDMQQMWTRGKRCPHLIAGCCRLAASIVKVPKTAAPVTEEQCYACMLCERPTMGQPNRIVAEIADAAIRGDTPAPPQRSAKTYDPTDLPCIHRSPEHVRMAKCKPCQNSGIDSLHVHRCSIFGECVIRGYAIEVQHVCLTCRDRKAHEPVIAPQQKKAAAKSLVFNRNGHPADEMSGQFANRACILVCGGPSVNEMDLSRLKERGVFVGAISQVAATHVRPQAWFSVDQCKTYHEAIWRDPGIMKFVAMQHRNNDRTGYIPLNVGGKWTDGPEARKCPNVWFYERGDKWALKEFLSAPWAMWNTTEDGGEKRARKSSMLVAMRLLYWLGFREIHLIGADFAMEMDRQYAFPSCKGKGGCRSNNHSYRALNLTFHRLRPIFESHGLRVYNATPNSKLTAFESVTLDEAIDRCRASFPREIDVGGLYH